MVTNLADNEPAPAAPMPGLPRHWRSLARAFVHQARAHPAAPAVVDASGQDLSYMALFERAVALGRVLSRRVRRATYIGLCVPPSVPGAVANLAIALRGKVPVNLNYTAGQDHIRAAIRQCRIEQVVAARQVMERFGIRPDVELIYLEDIPPTVTWFDRLWAAVVARAVPVALLGTVLPGLRDDRLDATAGVLFTSGTTGEPKGVVLSQRNLLSNIKQVEVHFQPLPDEVVLGVLPFFHAMGYTVSLWAVLCLGRRAVFHFNPLDAHVVGELCQRQRVTLIVATPTFMRFYLRRCGREQFSTLRCVMLGAEKLSAELAQDIRQTLGIEPLEAYGCTELSPVVSLNVDRVIHTTDGRTIDGHRLGTVGRPVPGTSLKTIGPDTGSDLPPGAEGIVCVKGPQVMVGYLNRPTETAEVVRDGWYVTGDIGRLDADGFLIISDRLSRFSKVGGEMVPHEKVEQIVRAAAGVDEHALVVTGVPDPRQGERLIVVYADLGGKSPDEVARMLIQGSTPRLWIPAVKDYIKIDALPRLGNGKIDLGQVRRLAQMAQMAEPPGHSLTNNGFSFQVHEGLQVLLRPIRADDRWRVAQGFAALSQESRQFRMFSAVGRLTEKELHYFTEVDQVNHVAWGAFETQTPQQHALGLARFIRYQADPTAAELAVTVLDAYQHQGLGTVLLGVLFLRAEAVRIDRLKACVLPQNHVAIDWLHALGAETVSAGEYLELELRLGHAGGANTTTPARARFDRLLGIIQQAAMTPWEQR